MLKALHALSHLTTLTYYCQIAGRLSFSLTSPSGFLPVIHNQTPQLHNNMCFEYIHEGLMK